MTELVLRSTNVATALAHSLVLHSTRNQIFSRTPSKRVCLRIYHRDYDARYERKGDAFGGASGDCRR